jgi:hypothetical protein
MLGLPVANCGRAVGVDEVQTMEAAFLAAYRWQYIHSGARHPHFGKVLYQHLYRSVHDRWFGYHPG